MRHNNENNAKLMNLIYFKCQVWSYNGSLLLNTTDDLKETIIEVAQHNDIKQFQLFRFVSYNWIYDNQTVPNHKHAKFK